MELQDFLSITSYDLAVICTNLAWITCIIVLFANCSLLFFDIDLSRLNNDKHRNTYLYVVYGIILATVVIMVGSTSRQAQESLLNEVLNLLLYFIVSVAAFIIGKILNYLNRYNGQVNNQMHQGNVAACLYHMSHILSTATLTSFIIRTFYAESIALILGMIVLGELFIMLIVSYYNISFYKDYRLSVCQAIINHDWQIAAQAATFRIYVTLSLCSGASLISLYTDYMMLSISLWVASSIVIMVVVLGLIVLLDRIFLQLNHSLYRIDAEKNGSICLLQFLIYVAVSFLIMYLIT